MRLNQTKKIGKGTAVRKQYEQRHKATTSICVLGAGGRGAGWCYHSINYEEVGDGKRTGRGSWALAAMLISFLTLSQGQ